MTQPAKISSMTVRNQGKPQARAESTTRENSELNAADQRWKPRQEEFKGKRWAECPPELSADFALGMARDLAQEYGTAGGMQMAALMTGSNAFAKSPQHLDLQLGARASGQGRARIDLIFLDIPEVQNEDDAAVEIVAKVDPRDLADTPQAVLDKVLAQDPQQPKRVPFDPLAAGALTATDVAALVAEVEKKLGGKDLDILCGAAMVLLAWRQAESNNAETVRLAVSGATSGKTQVYPGRELVMSATVILHDAKATLDPIPQDDLVQAHISVSRPKPRR